MQVKPCELFDVVDEFCRDRMFFAEAFRKGIPGWVPVEGGGRTLSIH